MKKILKQNTKSKEGLGKLTNSFFQIPMKTLNSKVKKIITDFNQQIKPKLKEKSESVESYIDVEAFDEIPVSREYKKFNNFKNL